MRRLSSAGAVAALFLLAGCASTGALEETEQVLVAEMHELQEGQDSLRAEMVRMRRALVDSLEARRGRSLTGQGELSRRLDRLQEELGRIAALLGENQRQIGRLSEQIAAAGSGGGGATGNAAGGGPSDGSAAGDTTAAADSAADGGEADPQGLYEASLQQFRRGAYGTARSGLQEFLSEFPDHELAPDAQYYVAESFAEADEPARALEAYGRVVELFPDSRRAASALYKSGRIELERGNTEDARVFFSRVVQGYPDSPEASLARDRLESLGGGGG